MNWTLVYDFFVNRLLAAKIEGIDKNSIAIPNKVFDARGKTTWIELSAFVGRAVQWTETQQIIHASMNILVCVQRDSFMAKASNLAERLAKHFSILCPENAFQYANNGLNFRCYCAGVDVLSGVTDSSGYRINVRISLDIYKEC